MEQEDMPDLTLEIGTHQVTFDKETVSGMETKKRNRMEIYIKPPDQDPVAAIFMRGLDRKPVDIHNDLMVELTRLHPQEPDRTAEVIVEKRGPDPTPIKINEKPWNIIELILEDDTTATEWYYPLDDKHWCKVIVDWHQENDPIEGKIENLVKSVKVAQRS